MVQVPALTRVAVVPETVQIVGVADVKLTVRPELAEALSVSGLPWTWDGMALNVMVCGFNTEPDEITKLTADPVLTSVPATGLSLITLPEGTVLLDAVVTVPTTKPAPVIAVIAAACVCPTTLGTATCAGPDEITRLTADPTLTSVPATGLSLITLPAGTVLLDALVSVPTTKPAPVIAVIAAACVCPTTLGTATCAGPDEITRLTADPTLTSGPATGLSLITLPAGTVLLDALVTVPTTKPAPVIAVV